MHPIRGIYRRDHNRIQFPYGTLPSFAIVALLSVVSTVAHKDNNLKSLYNSGFSIGNVIETKGHTTVV